ncbi:DUF969 domain-containing protein [Salinisphaera sp. USBA-960]|nr:DUF969 domain-containing protein [Salifodinibacter halophilus]NNC25356.1 DUF969 domain-containing protein [Salifodinibacter halophilus]
MEYWPLIGVVVVIIGFALRINALAVVTVAGLVTGLAAGMSPHKVVSALGGAYLENRYLAVIWIILPVIGLLERNGLREQAQRLIARVRQATTGRLLTFYLLFRQITSALGLLSLCGHPQMVRPLIAPMAEASTETRYGSVEPALRHRIRAHAAAVDNIGAFFGEDIFIAVGSILLMKGFLASHGFDIAPLDFARWAVPSAVCAFGVHGLRLWLLDRDIARTKTVTSVANNAEVNS